MRGKNMPELMKNKIFNYDSLHNLALRMKQVYSPFHVDDFINDIMDKTWDALELKARIHRITMNLGKQLPDDYEQALSIIDKVVASYPFGYTDFSLMCLPDFVETYGQDQQNLSLSMAALERYTSTSSSEFAVRPFIIKYEEIMMKQMASWAKHDNEHIRRLASEGCRPKLPWGQNLTKFIEDPTPILAILEQLKEDPSLYVRKSVANNLNDISKTHPDLIIKIAKNWYGDNEYTNWIVKHGCRTLLKKGNKDVLQIFGFTDSDNVSVDNFTLSDQSISIGECLSFNFMISVKQTAKIRLEYGIDYVKANGKRNRKIFQISEILLKENQEKQYTKVHSFMDKSTRKHYAGIHSITLLINGIERETRDFEVLAAYR